MRLAVQSPCNLQRVVLTLILCLFGRILFSAADPTCLRIISAWSFSDKRTLNHPTLVELVPVPGSERFVPTHRTDRFYIFSSPELNSLTGANQFALQRMLERKTITRERFDQYIGQTFPGNPEQVVLFERNNLTPWPFLNPFTEDEWVRLHYDSNDTPWVTQRVATLWSIAGQILQGNGWVRTRMPFQDEPIFAHLPAIPSSQFAWEWGRAGQFERREALLLGRAAVLQAAGELIALRGSLDDAFVYVHAVTQNLAHAYTLFYRFEAIEVTPDGHSLMRRSLRALLSDPNFAIESFAEKPARIAEITRYRLTGINLLHFLVGIQRLMHTRLDYRWATTESGRQPLAFYDRSIGFLPLAERLFERFGVLPDFERITQYLNGTRYYFNDETEVFSDRGPIPEMILGNPRSEVSLWGLSEEESKQDPEYERQILLGLWSYYRQRLNESDVSMRELLLDKIQFSIFTRESNIQARLEALGGHRSTVPFTEGLFNEGRLPFQSPTRGRVGETSAFTFSGIEMERIFKGLSSVHQERARFALHEGRGQALHLLRRALIP